MKFGIRLIGVGSGLSAGLGNSNALVSWNGVSGENRNLLIDCGPATMQKMAEEVSLSLVQNIYITHLHSDHIGGLEMTGFYHYFVSKTKPNLYVPKEYVDRLWGALKAGMEYIYDPNTGAAMQAGLQTYFNVFVFEAGDELVIDGLRLNVIRNDHVPYHPSYALIIDNRVYWSSDTTEVKEFLKYPLGERYEKRGGFYVSSNQNISLDAVFHDCQLFDAGGKANVHTPLALLGEEIHEKNRGKVWLMHYGNGSETPQIQQYVEEKGFAGFVKPNHGWFEF